MEEKKYKYLIKRLKSCNKEISILEMAKALGIGYSSLKEYRVSNNPKHNELYYSVKHKINENLFNNLTPSDRSKLSFEILKKGYEQEMLEIQQAQDLKDNNVVYKIELPEISDDYKKD